MADAHGRAAARPPSVLITRPEPGLAETAAAVAALGWAPVPAPALTLQPRAIPPLNLQASLITSRAAAASLPAGPPVLAVGEASAEAARALGHTAMAAAGDAQSLLALARARLRPDGGPLLLAVGKGYATDLAAGLRAAGFQVHRRLAYVAAPATALPPAALAALRAGEVAAALFFSPRSAESCMDLLVRAGLGGAVTGIRAVAISPRVARLLAKLPWARIDIAGQPDQAAMLAALGRAD